MLDWVIHATFVAQGVCLCDPQLRLGNFTSPLHVQCVARWFPPWFPGVINVMMIVAGQEATSTVTSSEDLSPNSVKRTASAVGSPSRLANAAVPVFPMVLSLCTQSCSRGLP